MALGTVPRAGRFMSEPVSECSATLAAVIAAFAILPLVTEEAFSWREPTLLGGTRSAA